MAFTSIQAAAAKQLLDPSALAPFLNPNYAGGFGATALQNARNSGLSDNEIRSALSASGLTIGQKAGQALGANTDLYQYRGSGGQFGAGSLAAAQAAGMSNAQIRTSLAQSGLQIGDQASQTLNVNPGKTYIGIAPGTRTEYQSNSGTTYGLRPQLAPRGYGMNSGYGGEQGYSPTFYIAGGEDDHHAHNFLFGTDYQGGPDIGGGYTDPDFNRVNYVPPANDPFRPYGGYGQYGMGIGNQGGMMNTAMQAFNNVLSNYGMSGNTTNNVTTPSSFGSAGSTNNTARGVRTAGSPGSGTTYNTLNRSGSADLSISGLNMG